MIRLLLQWAGWALVFGLILGGKPWRFPRDGRTWLSHPVSGERPASGH